MMIEVIRIHTKDGRDFYTDTVINNKALRLLLDRCDWQRVEKIEMDEQAYRDIPATQDAVEIFAEYHKARTLK